MLLIILKHFHVSSIAAFIVGGQLLIQKMKIREFALRLFKQKCVLKDNMRNKQPFSIFLELLPIILTLLTD